MRPIVHSQNRQDFEAIPNGNIIDADYLAVARKDYNGLINFNGGLYVPSAWTDISEVVHPYGIAVIEVSAKKRMLQATVVMEQVPANTQIEVPFGRRIKPDTASFNTFNLLVHAVNATDYRTLESKMILQTLNQAGTVTGIVVMTAMTLHAEI